METCIDFFLLKHIRFYNKNVTIGIRSFVINDFNSRCNAYFLNIMKKTIFSRIANNKCVHIVHICVSLVFLVYPDWRIVHEKKYKSKPRREIYPNPFPPPHLPSYSHRTALFSRSRNETCTSRKTWITVRRDWKNFHIIIVRLLVCSKYAIRLKNPIDTTPETTRHWVQK